jgi:hypothetical protein
MWCDWGSLRVEPDLSVPTRRVWLEGETEVISQLIVSEQYSVVAAM